MVSKPLPRPIRIVLRWQVIVTVAPGEGQQGSFGKGRRGSANRRSTGHHVQGGRIQDFLIFAGLLLVRRRTGTSHLAFLTTFMITVSARRGHAVREIEEKTDGKTSRCPPCTKSPEYIAHHLTATCGGGGVLDQRHGVVSIRASGPGFLWRVAGATSGCPARPGVSSSPVRFRDEPVGSSTVPHKAVFGAHLSRLGPRTRWISCPVVRWHGHCYAGARLRVVPTATATTFALALPYGPHDGFAVREGAVSSTFARRWFEPAVAA